MGFRTKYPISFPGSYVGEKEGEKENTQVFFLQSSKFRVSKFVELRTKVHHLNGGYAYGPKTKSFTEDQKEEIWTSQMFWA